MRPPKSPVRGFFVGGNLKWAAGPFFICGGDMAKTDELTVLCKPVVEGLGFLFWGVEYIAQGRNTVLRIYIDHADGVTVDHCADVSRQMAAVLDVEDPIGSAYTLEVSSPGLDRPLFTLAQCNSQAGHWLRLRLREPFEGKRKLKGLLVAVEDESLVIRVGEYDYVLPWEQIEKANVIPVFDDGSGDKR